MTTPDEQLAALLSDAVSDIEPADRLDAIRDRTKVTSMTSRRPWLIASGGAVLATAAVITAIALAGNQDSPAADPISPGTNAVSPSQTPQQSATPGLTTYAIYYLGATPSGTRLFREFRQAAGPTSLATAIELVTSLPDDPDYQTGWPVDAFGSATYAPDQGVIRVELADASLHDRPSGMTEEEASMSIDQVVYTLQAAVHERAAVQFVLDGNPIDQVHGVPTGEPLANGKATEVLSLMSISDPAEGQVVSGSFVARGVNNAFEATYQWELRLGSVDGPVVDDGFGTAEGCCEPDRLFAWKTDPIDVSGLQPGTYTFIAKNDDPSGGAEGNGPDTDTRTIVVE